jgi:hypothetical protein
MHGPTSAGLLLAWEYGLTRTPTERARAVLSAAHDEDDAANLVDVPVGARDDLLLTLRERAFGTDITSVVDCPGCGERVEAAFRTSDVRVGSGLDDEPLEVSVAGFTVRFRLPTSRDLIAIQSVRSSEEAAELLERRCTLQVTSPSGPHQGRLPARVSEALASRMSEVDPRADIMVAVQCPGCELSWETPFDIASFLWTEVHAWACRLIRDVHCLASAYGWSEASIIAMNPRRRQFYLNLIGQ